MLYTTSMGHRAMCETDLWSLLTPTLSLIDTDCNNVAQKLPLKKYNNSKRMENKLLIILKTISMKKNTNMPVVVF